MKLCPFDSVGLVVENKKGQILVLERKRFPPGLAFPAGHLDIVNGQKELFKDAAVRELREETGLTAKSLSLLLEKTFPNPCSKGYDVHHWQVFLVHEWEGEPTLMEPDKHTRLWWIFPEEIQDWIRTGKPTDPAWLSFIFPKINLSDKLRS